MLYRRHLVTLAVVALLALATAPAAPAAPCGKAAKPGASPVVGELALDTENSDDPSLASFGGKTKARDIAFIFKVSGCTLGTGTDVKARSVGNESDALTLAAPEPKGELLVVTGTVDPKKFDPGEHKPKLVLSSPGGLVKAQSLKLTLKRKEPPALPIILSAIAALLGIAYACFVAHQAAVDAYDKKKAEQANDPPPKRGLGAMLFKKHDSTDGEDKKVKYGGITAWLVVLVGAAGGAGAAFSTGYIKSDTWSLDLPDPIILMVAVGAAAAGGAAAGLVKAISANDLPKPRGGEIREELERDPAVA